VVEPGPAVLDLQERLIEAVKPFTGSGGTADAYVRTEAEPDINDKNDHLHRGVRTPTQRRLPRSRHRRARDAG
jgi:hypothetical protein